MKSKATLFLMEQLVMVLVFALSAALCLQVFLRAEEISLETARRSEAVVIAQNAAELLKAGSNIDEAEEKCSREAYVVQIQEIPEEIPGLKQAEIAVFYEKTELFSLTVGFQEVGG